MGPVKKPVRSKSAESFEPVQINRKNRLSPKGLDTCKPPLRRSARLREKKISRKVDYSSKSRRQSPKRAKIHENPIQSQLQLKSKSPQTKKGEKDLSTKRKRRNQRKPLSTSRQIRSDCKQLRTRDTQEITQGINKNKDNLIKNWLSTVPSSLENLVNPFLQKTSENMSSHSDLSLDSGGILDYVTPSAGSKITPTAGGVRAPDFRDSLRKHNIFINCKDPSTELVNRAEEIITNRKSSPEMDDALAQELAITAENLETEAEEEIIVDLGRVLIPTKKNLHQNLKCISNKLWTRAAVIPPDPNSMAILPDLPRPKPDMVFGYSQKAFDTNQLAVLDFLSNLGTRNYAMPDGCVAFPFLVVEFKAQAAGATHFIATNQVANAGAVAMEGTLQLTKRISAEENIDFDEPQFFSISIDHAMACINVHWLSRDAKNGAFCFHMKHLKNYVLDVNGLKAVDRAIKNILDYGLNKRLAKMCGELNIYGKRIAEIRKGNLASDSLTKEQRSRKRKSSDLFANQRESPRIKRPRQAQKNFAYDEDEEEREELSSFSSSSSSSSSEEGATFSAAGQRQISRKKIKPTNKDSGLNLRKKAAENLKAKRGNPAPPPPKTGGASTKLLAVHVPAK